MHVLYFVLYLLALVCFIASAFQVSARKVNLLAFGLAFFVAVPMLQQLRLL